MKKVFFIFFLLFAFTSFGQINVKAKLVNAETLNIIEFASVLNLENLEGTISDTLGWFNLNVADNETKLMIQSLGFKPDTFTVRQVQNLGIIKLEVNDFQISDVVVYPKNSFDIIRIAVSKIKDNYNADVMAQNVFSREQMFANGQLLGVREANFNALAKFKNNKNANLISINKARYFADTDTLKHLGKMVAKQLSNFDTTLMRKDAEQFFKMNFFLSDDLEEVKTDLFGEKSLKFYEYSYNGIVEKDDFIAYHVTFDQKDDLKKSLYKGHAYIDTATYGFIEIQIYASPKGVVYQKYVPKSMKMLLKLFGFTFYIKDMGYKLHFRQINNKWVLDHADTKIDAIVSKKGYSYDGFMKAMYDVSKFYPKEEYYNRKSEYDKIGSEIEKFRDIHFFDGLHYIPMGKKIK